MSIWSRIGNVFRGEQLNREIDEEFESHIKQAIAEGNDPAEVRRTFGSQLRLREQSHDARVVAWLDGLRPDVVFGSRQLMKHKATTAIAVLSLAMAMGACASAFRLIDALLWRPLPISHPERLYVLSRQGAASQGNFSISDSWAYPDFAQMRAAVGSQAELLAVSYADRMDLTYTTDEETEKGYVQYVSGSMFDSFGLQPALGKLLTEQDDRTPGAAPYAVLSYDYWTRRFARDPKVLGLTFRLGEQLFEIVGIGPESFTGTEPGTMTDIFVPMMMHPSVTRSDSSWHRTLAIIQPGVAVEPLRAKLDAATRNFEAERAKGLVGLSQQEINNSLNQNLLLEPATTGVSKLKDSYRVALTWLGILVALVLLIACANVANLMAAQATSRTREMALRVSIGAGRLRLVQMVMVENVMLALLAAALGGVFAWWSAPMVVRLIQPSDNPARLRLPADWYVLGFGLLLTLAVTLLFGLAPALRASAIQPVSALKGGEEPRVKKQFMYIMIAAQVTFCFVVLFLAGLFVATFRSLSNQPLGFEAKGLLLIETVAPHGNNPAAWTHLGETLHSVPGVDEVAESGWPLMSSTGGWNGLIAVNGTPQGDEWGYFLPVSPRWLETMKMNLIEGRDIQSTDSFPGEAIVNQTFAMQFFKGTDPLGKTFEKVNPGGTRQLSQVVGVVADAPYRRIREPIFPVAFVPLRQLDATGAVKTIDSGTLLLRTTAKNPLILVSEIRRRMEQAGAGFRISNAQTQQELLDNQTIRERLLAFLALFFACVALLLAAIGLYGVLSYSVLQREREIGIRVALGASAGNIARLVTVRVFATVIVGAALGSVLGISSVRYVQSLLFGVKGSEPGMLVLPIVALLCSALLAALPAVLRASHIDPAIMLRAE